MNSTTHKALPLLLLAALVTSPRAAPAGEAAAAEVLTPAASTVTVEGTSSLHAWKVSAKSMRGALTLPASFLAGEPATGLTAKFSLRVSALRSEHDRMNRIMWDSLLVKKHPEITFELQLARVLPPAPTGGTRVEVKGLLNVAGVAKPVTTVFDVRREGTKLVAKGELPLEMSDFSIDPPTAMMGTIRTGDAVRVTIEVTLAPRS